MEWKFPVHTSLLDQNCTLADLKNCVLKTHDPFYTMLVCRVMETKGVAIACIRQVATLCLFSIGIYAAGFWGIRSWEVTGLLRCQVSQVSLYVRVNQL